MRLRQLAAFVRVCQLGSITRAAADLNIAQPALGLQIRNLEAEFGVDLILRGSRGVRLTPCGEVVLAWAQEVLRSREDVGRRLQEVVASGPATLKLGLPPGVAAAISDRLLEWANAESRPITLKIITAHGGDIAQLVEMEQLDLGLTCTSRMSPSIGCRPLMVERLYFMTSSNGGCGPITLAEVLRRPLALPERRDTIRQALNDAARKTGTAVNCAIEITALEIAKELAAAGIAGSITPLGRVLEAQELGLSIRPIVSPPVTRLLHLVRHSDRVASDTEQRLIDIVIEALLSFGDDPTLRPYQLPVTAEADRDAPTSGASDRYRLA